ncbi:MAG TPA: hypothetical protein DCP31_22570, partial [Cyanobacteria bacterium UBA8543]|nr:hypothetical protein [Cyanobacteria bacterium UBA8543]
MLTVAFMFTSRFMGCWNQATLLSEFLEFGLTTESSRQMNWGKAPTSTSALAFLKSKVYWLVALLSAEMGWGCQCCEILQPLSKSQNLYERMSVLSIFLLHIFIKTRFIPVTKYSPGKSPIKLEELIPPFLAVEN